MAVKGIVTSQVTRNEKTGQNDLLNKVEKQLAELSKKVKDGTKPPQFLRSMGGSLTGGLPMGSVDTGIPMNDEALKDSMEFHTRLTKETASTQVIRELTSRLAEMDDRLPEFIGLNSWDVIIKPLKSTATLEEVIKTLNTLIQRNQRQIRIK